MSEGDLQAQNLPLSIAPDDPKLAQKTYEAVRQMSDQITELRNRIRNLESRVLN
jgi:hypothetical protein